MRGRLRLLFFARNFIGRGRLNSAHQPVVPFCKLDGEPVRSRFSYCSGRSTSVNCSFSASSAVAVHCWMLSHGGVIGWISPLLTLSRSSMSSWPIILVPRYSVGWSFGVGTAPQKRPLSLFFGALSIMILSALCWSSEPKVFQFHCSFKRRQSRITSTWI